MDDLLDKAPCGFLAFSDDGTIQLINSTLLELLGYTHDALDGRRLESILTVGSRIFYQTHFFPLLKLHGKVEEVYFSLKTQAGDELPVLVNAVRRERDGAVFNDCILVQIHQRNQYEDEILQAKKAAEEATRAKDEFLAVVSHELRTPLTAILGWARMLRSPKLQGDDLSRGLETIERNARMQSRLIEDILDLSRIITGKLRLDVRAVELSEVIEAAIDVVRTAADAKNMRLQLDLDTNTGPVSGDPARLQQVFWNLLSNAIKFTPEGGLVEVRMKRINSNIEVSVTDNGRGISPEFLPYVFERFRQAEKRASREGGLGLGLGITRHIVELHGGTLNVSSPGLGHGTTFTVSLPLIVLNKTEQLGADAHV
jgi:PAS domain S-box-containing protein